MKVYVAGSFRAKHDLKNLGKLLEANDHECTSRWLDQEAEVVFDLGDDAVKEEANREARKDFEDIDRSDAVIVDTHVTSTTGGFFVELGYALARQKPVIIVGARRNIFMFLGATQVDSWYDAIVTLNNREQHG